MTLEQDLRIWILSRVIERLLASDDNWPAIDICYRCMDNSYGK